VTYDCVPNHFVQVAGRNERIEGMSGDTGGNNKDFVIDTVGEVPPVKRIIEDRICNAPNLVVQGSIVYFRSRGMDICRASGGTEVTVKVLEFGLGVDILL
jgi:hypothetical protein